jgi:ribosomal protein S28E/S33
MFLAVKRNERKLAVVHTRNAISPLAFGDIVCLLDSVFPLDKL